MNVVNANYTRYEYPQGINDFESFIVFVNKNLNQFVAMRLFDEENCSFPYLIKEDTKAACINFSNIGAIFEEEVTILSRAEYDKRLAEVVEQKCRDCENYEEHVLEDNLAGHRATINLDGECPFYCKKNAESNGE